MNKSIKFLGITLLVGIICSVFYQQYPTSEDKNRFLANSSQDDTSDAEFNTFLSKYKKGYTDTAEFVKRKNIFKANKKIINSHNSKSKKSFTLGLNKFADMTADEFKSLLTYKSETPDAPSVDESTGRNLANAASIDWRTSGAVSSVKDQVLCGGCYAFSTVAAIEGIYYIKYGVLYDFSHQQIIDCTTNNGCYGCNGGIRSGAFRYMNSSKLQPLSTYPFVGYQQSTCNYQSTYGVASTIGYTWVTPYSVSALMTAVNKQPVTITLDGSQYVFQYYTSGIIDSTSCYTEINHAVLLVGYGTDSTTGVDYWIVKNSWGTWWGESGYVRITRDTTYSGTIGVCGLLYQPLYPSIA